MLDQLTLLVDKSLVVADDCQGRTRYRLLETVRRYALEKLGDSGEADVHARHRDYYTALAASLNTPADNDHQRLVARAETEIDNLRAAFAWSRENGHITEALQLASSLQPIWFGRAHLREGCPGSTRSWKTKGSTGSLCQQQYGRERSLTRQCSVPGWPPVR